MAIKPQPLAEDGRCLLGFASGTVLLVDLPLRRALAVRVSAAGGPRLSVLAWVGRLGCLYAAGYADGSAELWAVDAAAAPWAAPDAEDDSPSDVMLPSPPSTKF